MSSVQQVAIASVCLVAAFAFGSYINQSEIDQALQQVDPSSDGLHSLIEPELVVQKIPGSTPLMRPKLSARLPMPKLSHRNPPIQSSFGLGQPATMAGNSQGGNFPGGNFPSGEIPPPSDLTGRIKPTQSSLASSFSIAPNSSGLVTDAPTFDAKLSGESAMPVVNQQDFGSSLNLADSMRAPLETDRLDEPRQTVINAPVFDVAEATKQTMPTGHPNSQANQSPNQSFNASVVDNAPSFPNLNRRTQPFTAAKPALPNRQTAPLPSFGNNNEVVQQPTMIREPAPSRETASRDQFRFSNLRRDDNRRNQNSLMPIPRLNQTVTIGDPGAAFGNRDPKEIAPKATWSNSGESVTDNSDYYPEQNQPQQQQRRVARLPLQLNSSARSKLTRLRDNTIQKISLRTTQFSQHVVQRGESLQSIASQYFGKPDYYLDIYLANRDRLRFPGDLREGMSIKIPVYEQ